jgi:hypothetical protein
VTSRETLQMLAEPLADSFETLIRIGRQPQPWLAVIRDDTQIGIGIARHWKQSDDADRDRVFDELFQFAAVHEADALLLASDAWLDEDGAKRDAVLVFVALRDEVTIASRRYDRRSDGAIVWHGWTVFDHVAADTLGMADRILRALRGEIEPWGDAETVHERLRALGHRIEINEKTHVHVVPSPRLN